MKCVKNDTILHLNQLKQNLNLNSSSKVVKIAKNPVFGYKIAYKKILGIFCKNRYLSLFYPYYGLTLCAKAKKSLEQFSRKNVNGNRAGLLTDHGTDFIGPYGP